MKGDIPRITLIGSNSGRNLGDAAILASILSSMTKELPNAEFYVPSTNPDFVEKNYGKRFRVKGLSIWPWTFSIRLIGLPTFRAIWKSDVALICDGIIFGRKLWNPFFNWLNNLVFVVPFAKLVGCKVALFSCGIGPFPSKLSRWMAKFVINSSDLVMMRENDSKKLAEEIGVTKPIELTGDAAFMNEVSADSVADAILEKEGISSGKALLGVNVTAYFNTWLTASDRNQSKEDFLKTLADGIKSANEKLNNAFTPLLFSTHPMDEKTVADLAKHLDAKIISNSYYLSHDIQAVMRRCELFIGMRFHSLVLSSAVGAPIIGLVYMPKVRGYMRLLKCEELSIELASVSKELIQQKIIAAWNNRDELKNKQQLIVTQLKEAAFRAARLVRENFFSN
ncbi:MAG: polysaccharide pyruvyl transferase family protein [SAR324 cluster bacterium]|uniref:Polysaccharide pyruvyl transferase family protein n=1 Tax=SAR324 cluster bacterium TaxID=2024889 RepID=A0A7X9IJD5_9DELT|nr:polysaccharide pyruvyl transferase family protein [SAR324 cluster bacterium]